MRPIAYDTIMALSEKEISELFPNGAVEGKKGWQPAEKLPDRTLKKLLQDKKARTSPGRYLAASSAHRLRWSKKEGKWVSPASSRDEDIGYTDRPELAMKPDAGQGLEADEQEEYSKAAEKRFDQIRGEDKLRDDLRSYLARLRQVAIAQIRAGSDPTPVFQRAMTDLEDREAA